MSEFDNFMIYIVFDLLYYLIFKDVIVYFIKFECKVFLVI